MSKLYRVTVTRTTSGLVWADDESEARDFGPDVEDEGDSDWLTDARAVNVSRLSDDDLDSLPRGGPGDFTVRQLLADEHKAPPPGPPESLDAAAVAAWLALSSHRGLPLSYAGTTDGLVGITNGHAILFVPGDSAPAGLPDIPTEKLAKQIAAPLLRRGSVAWTELDRVCRDHVPDDGLTKTVVCFGRTAVDVALLRRWAWGPAAVGAEDVAVEWSGELDPVRVRGATWTAVIMPVRWDADGPVVAMEVRP